MLWVLVSLTSLAAIGAGTALLAGFRSYTHAERSREALRELSSALSSLAALEVQSVRNTETLRKLSGMVYKRKQQDEQEETQHVPNSEEQKASWKAAMRRKYGLTR